MRERIKRTIVSDALKNQYPPEEGWRVFNAPRPLLGTRTWRGDFIAGLFYAAVAADDPDRKMCLQANFDLDAIELQIIDEREYEQRLALISKNFEEEFGSMWVRLGEDIRRDMARQRFGDLRESTWRVED